MVKPTDGCKIILGGQVQLSPLPGPKLRFSADGTFNREQLQAILAELVEWSVETAPQAKPRNRTVNPSPLGELNQ